MCKCAAGSAPRSCGTHPGLDGSGPCKAGTQSCVLAANNASSDWGACSGSVGPMGADSCDAGNDNNCNGRLNEGCACTNGSSVPCACGPAATCTNGTKGTCSVSQVTRYQDSDGDTYGNPAKASQVCPGAAGYVTNADDCDDSSASVKPGVSICGSATERKSCVAAGSGVWNSQTCEQGCFGGNCRSDGTVGVPGFVSCLQTPPITRCLPNVGCFAGESACGTPSNAGTVHCDGPNDCPNQVCCAQGQRGATLAQCYDGACPASWEPVCDPLAGSCNCVKFGVNDGVSFYVCR